MRVRILGGDLKDEDDLGWRIEKGEFYLEGDIIIVGEVLGEEIIF